MSEQAKIIAQMQALIMEILKTGTTDIEQANKMDALERELFKQRAFKAIKHDKHEYQGEEIATLFFEDKYTQAIDKLYDCKISAEDFFGFVDYYYDEDHDDEELTEMFSSEFMAKVKQDYQTKCDLLKK